MDWLTLAEIFRCDSVRLFLLAALGGSFGKTCRTCCESMEGGPFGGSPERFGNAGILSPIECWTLDISESPSVVVECSLSDTLDDGSVPPEFFLTDKQLQRLRERAEKYQPNNSRLLEILSAAESALQATKPQSTASQSRPRSARNKAAKA